MKSKKGILSNRQWAALVRLWEAGEQGIDREEMQYSRAGFAWSPTLVRLWNYAPEPLMHYCKPAGMLQGVYRISEFGYQFYEEHWHAYRERYPDVQAPQPLKTDSE